LTPRTVKLSPDDEAKETEVFTFYGVKGEIYSEQYRDFLSKLHRAMRLNVIIETPDNPAMHPIENFTNLRCPMRKRVNVPHKDNKTGALLWTEEKIYCVDNPPRATQLLGMEVCEVCIAKFYGLAKKLRAANPDNVHTPKAKAEREEPPTLQPIDMPAITKKLFLAHYDGRKHCPFNGERILSQTCYLCSTQNPKLHNECRTLVASIIPPQKQT
jgi:hypothetical protein